VVAFEGPRKMSRDFGCPADQRYVRPIGMMRKPPEPQEGSKTSSGPVHSDHHPEEMNEPRQHHESDYDGLHLPAELKEAFHAPTLRNQLLNGLRTI
jgi:hypothetical protein